MRWLVGVVELPGDMLPLVVVQPETQDVYEGLRGRLVKVGFARLSRSECERGAWSAAAPGTVLDAAQGQLVRLLSRVSDFFPGARVPVSEQWLWVGRERGRALVALLPPDWCAIGVTAEELPGRMHAAAQARRLVAATVELRVDAVALTGPGWS